MDGVWQTFRGRLCLALLALAALATLREVHAFSERRFFTVDEYQTMHASWLVARGERPYLDSTSTTSR